jgi:hypothetical protein
MPRTKFSSVTKQHEVAPQRVHTLIKRCNIIRFPNNCTVPSPFRIYKKGTLPSRDTILRWSATYGEGNSKIQMDFLGPAIERQAETVAYAVLKLCKVYGQTKFMTNYAELLRAANKSDSQPARRLVWDRLGRLKEQNWTLHLYDDKGEETIECLYSPLTEVVQNRQDGRGRIWIEVNDLFVFQNQKTGWTPFDTAFQASLRLDIGAHLYRFYQRHYSEKKLQQKFPYGRVKLLTYLNLKVPAHYAPWQTWHLILKPGFEELKQKGYFTSYAWVPATDVITVRYAKRVWVSEKHEAHEPADHNFPVTLPAARKAYAEVIDVIRQAFPREAWDDIRLAKLAKILGRTEKYLEPYVTNLKTFMKRYADWLQGQRLKYMSPALFGPENDFFRQYMDAFPLEKHKDLKVENKRQEEERERNNRYYEFLHGEVW